MACQAVLFDLDGTLLDTAADLVAACTHTLRRHGIEHCDEGRIRGVLTAGMRRMLLSCIPEAERGRHDLEAMRAEFARRYTAHINEHTRPFEGIPELLSALVARGLVTGVITSKLEYMARQLLEQYPFYPQLAIVLGGDSVARSKPDPLPLTTAMDRLGVTAAATVYVGDHRNDLLCANRAGAIAACARWGYGSRECGFEGVRIDLDLDRPAALGELLAAGRI